MQLVSVLVSYLYTGDYLDLLARQGLGLLERYELAVHAQQRLGAVGQKDVGAVQLV